MEVIKTTVGRALKTLFIDNIAFTIAAFLVEDPEEKEEDYKAMCATLYGKTMKNKKEKFLRYCKNLRYDSFFVYSYDTAVIKLNWKHKTALRLGRWSRITSTHMNYAIRMLEMCYNFKEIKVER
jgi:hypothetical protein